MLDSDKLLVVVDTATAMKASTEEGRLHYYVFFTNREGLRFGYAFQVHRDLHSMMLHEDLKTLEEGRYVEHGSGFRVTEKGKAWINGLPSEQHRMAKDTIERVLKQYKDADELALFKDAYALVTAGI